MGPFRISIIGLGKIAQDQHLPVIRANPDFELAAVASQRGVEAEGVPSFTSHTEMLAQVTDLDAVAICTPPSVRHAIAAEAIAAGKHVLLEKPPAATLSELIDLERRAAEAGVVLFATWHSQFNAGVEEARSRLAGRRVRRLFVNWKEDVRRWHPGQQWIWQAGGFGVFDPGINALSIVARIMPMPLFIRGADLFFPENRDAPIAATLEMASDRVGDDLRAEFDWRQTGEQSWEITLETDDGTVYRLYEGGSRLEVDGRLVVAEPSAEYQGIYARFATLLREQRFDVDAAPFRLVADAFMIGRRVVVEPFED